MQLTKLTDLFLCEIYKEFLEKRKDGHSMDYSMRFQNNFENKCSVCSTTPDDDVSYCLKELKDNGMVTVFIGGNFILTKDAILYMENRFKNGLKEVIDFISKFIH